MNNYYVYIPVSFESSRNLFNGGSSLDLMMELEKLKSYLNNVELQLYEANEHISDLLEKVDWIMSLLLFFNDTVIYSKLWNWA